MRLIKSAAQAFCLLLYVSHANAADKPGFLFVNATVTDFKKLGAYGQALPPVYAQYGGQYVIFGGIGRGVEVLAGNAKHESLIFARFDSLEDVEKFWWSDEYRAVVPLRDGAGQFDVLGVEGTGEEPFAPENGVQPAYLFTLVKVKDREKTTAYMDSISDYAATAPNRVIAVGSPGETKVLEGPDQDFFLEISSWPSMASIREFIEHPRFAGTTDLRNEAFDFLLLAAEVPKRSN